MPKPRKDLSMPGLISAIRLRLIKAKLKTPARATYSTEDCVMSCFAMFVLKYSSMLKFDEEKNSETVLKRNLKKLFGVEKAPSDTTMRKRLDELEPLQLRQIFKAIFTLLQRGKVLEKFKYLDGRVILSIDGTGQFSSTKVNCKNCCERKSKEGTCYYHHLLGACLVHPEIKQVIPLAPEPISKSDGKNKNDCERNATKRLLKDYRREHPHLKTLVVEDGLASNHPHLSLLDSLNIDYIVGVKPKDHVYLFEFVSNLAANNHSHTTEDGSKHEYEYYNNIPLNATHHDYLLQVIRYTETKKNGKQIKFSWVTSMQVNDGNVYQLMRAARARWRIENETFNTLKNQGYNFEHNYGHGNKNLCSIMSMLMMAAFLTDQTQELTCHFYQELRLKFRTKYSIFERIRILIDMFHWDSWLNFYEFMLYGPPDTDCYSNS